MSEYKRGITKNCGHATCNGPCRRVKKPKPKHVYKKKIVKPVPKISVKHKKRLRERKLLTARDRLFFQEIWEECEHFCFETGEYLGEECLTLYCHHVFEKATYPALRYKKWNIVLISHLVHDQVGMDIDKCPKIKAYKKFIGTKYKKQIKHRNHATNNNTHSRC